MENSGESLIFLICTHRTGSTLLQQMLASHSEIHTTASPWALYFLMYGLRKDNGKQPIGIEAEYDAEIANLNLNLFLQSQPDGTSLFYEAVRKAALHLYGAAMEGTGKKYFLEKNVRHYLIVPELMKTFPMAKFIFVVRNPMAQFTGIIKWFKTDWRVLRNRYIDFHRAHFLIRDGIQQFSDRASVVRYEELVLNPEQELQRLCQELNIEYQDMSDYGARIQPMTNYQIVGLGDATTLRRHSRPVNSYIDDWPQYLDTSQKVYYAKSWLHGMGREIFEDLDYSYDDALDIVSAMEVNRDEIYATWDLISDPELSYEKEQLQQEKDLLNTPKPDYKIRVVDNPTVISSIVSVWECRYGINKGNIIIFHPDGFFQQTIVKKKGAIAGRYNIDELSNPHGIDLHIEEHFVGKEGVLRGIFEVEEDTLRLGYGQENQERMVDIEQYNYWYRKNP